MFFNFCAILLFNFNLSLFFCHYFFISVSLFSIFLSLFFVFTLFFILFSVSLLLISLFVWPYFLFFILFLWPYFLFFFICGHTFYSFICVLIFLGIVNILSHHIFLVLFLLRYLIFCQLLSTFLLFSSSFFCFTSAFCFLPSRFLPPPPWPYDAVSNSFSQFFVIFFGFSFRSLISSVSLPS